ncbi:MAG TPA: PIN domain-containing protein [bacterium]|nr:PIN domain-containing protein [bacterium]
MRLYLDTSVFGAIFDEEPPGREETTRSFFRRAKVRRDDLYISDVVLDEIARAPAHLRPALEELVSEVGPMVLPESSETLELAEAYLGFRIVPPRFRDDARHVAVASVAGVEALVSWNFKHLVNLRRKRLIHSVNLRFGYPLIDLISPEEVLYG